ncbi:MAG: PepSY domain-containing protein [Lautropia sp.]|nr:PepSY domain-containing protein [Lautropia sp.]
MKKLLFPLCLFVLAVGALPKGALAVEHEDVRRAVMAGRYKPLADILESVQKKYDARVLDVELEREPDGRHIYEVKMLDAKGRRQAIHIDAVTGQEVVQPESPGIPPLADTLRKVLEVYPGRVIDVDLKRNAHLDGIYLVRVLQEDGDIRSVFVEASSGKLVTEIEYVKSSANMKSLPDLLEDLQKNYPGTVLEAELKYDSNQQPYYEIDLLLSEGRLTEIWVDPASGRVLGEEEMEVR